MDGHSHPATGASEPGVYHAIIKSQNSQINLNYQDKSVYKQRKQWLGLIRMLLAGFNPLLEYFFKVLMIEKAYKED